MDHATDLIGVGAARFTTHRVDGIVHQQDPAEAGHPGVFGIGGKAVGPVQTSSYPANLP